MHLLLRRFLQAEPRSEAGPTTAPNGGPGRRRPFNGTPLISVIVPTRPHESLEPTLATLMAQTIQDFEVHVIVDHERRGACWARNRGAELARGDYLLFSDNDIEWSPTALETMVEALRRVKEYVDAAGQRWTVGYAYGGYDMQGDAFCMQPWNMETLKNQNFVSTMSLIRREIFPGFDESMARFQDWELWLRLALRHGVAGVWVPRILFRTKIRLGITFGGEISSSEATRIVKRKFGL